MRLGAILPLLLLPCAFAANQPTFNYFLTPAAQISAIATDAAGNTYLAGTSSVEAITATPGAFQTQPHTGTCALVPLIGAPIACSDAFVVKLNPFGNVVFATYLGGSGSDVASGVAVDQQGNVYVAGSTLLNNIDNHSNTFPITPGAAFSDPARAQGFIAKLNPAGEKLVYATFIQGAAISAIALDRDANVYFTGTNQYPSSPAYFPTTEGAFQVTPKGSGNLLPGVAGKLNASGSALIYATYLSGSTAPENNGASEHPQSIAVDSNGNAFIGGYTSSSDYPVTPGAFQTSVPSDSLGTRSVFLTKLNSLGTGLVYSTYIGIGENVTVRVDAQDTAFLAGKTISAKFPTVGVQASTFNGLSNGFLSRVNADGSSLIYSTYLPTYDAKLDADIAGNAVVAGYVISGGLPTGAGEFQSDFAGGFVGDDLYIARLTSEGRLSGATYLGGAQQDDFATAIALAPNGSVVIARVAQARSISNIVTSLFPFLTIENAASYVATKVAPGEVVSLRGYGLGPATGVSATGSSLPTELGGVSVTFGGYPAPLLYAQANQINAQVPWELVSSGSTDVQVFYADTDSVKTPVQVATTAPGIFYVNNADGTRNSPSNPAKPGDYISIYGTGGGPASPAGVTGEPWPLSTQLTLLTASTSATIADKSVQIVYAGASPLNSSGFFQINAILPTDLQPASNTPLSLTIGDASSAVVPIAIGTR